MVSVDAVLDALTECEPCSPATLAERCACPIDEVYRALADCDDAERCAPESGNCWWWRLAYASRLPAIAVLT